ncbi:hypothetical protein GW17_00048692 [Ensete ventricosum]|nr:hypothetical protein GW17_00048692 [Ensete ventricosum]
MCGPTKHHASRKRWLRGEGWIHTRGTWLVSHRPRDGARSTRWSPVPAFAHADGWTERGPHSGRRTRAVGRRPWPALKVGVDQGSGTKSRVPHRGKACRGAPPSRHTDIASGQSDGRQLGL